MPVVGPGYSDTIPGCHANRWVVPSATHANTEGPALAMQERAVHVCVCIFQHEGIIHQLNHL